MKRRLKIAFSSLVGALTLVVVLASIPSPVDLPDDIRATAFTTNGKHFVLVEGSEQDAMSQLVATRVMYRPNNVILLDRVCAPFVFYTIDPIVNRLPILIPLDNQLPGDYTLRARVNGQLKTLGHFLVGERVPS